MECVEGTRRDKLLREKGALAPGRAADFAYQAAQALQHAHEKGLIHRDVKPSNLLVTSKGAVKLLDLGLSRFLQDQIVDGAVTHEGIGMGTPDYAAPEQFRDAHSADERADVYELGCTLYHLLTGKPPFPGSSFHEKYEAHAKKKAQPVEEINPDVPGGLAMVVEKMMAKQPIDRFQTAAEVTEALSPFVAGSSVQFESIRSTSKWRLQAPTTPQGRISPRRLPWAIAFVAVLALAVTFLGFVTPGWFRKSSDPGEDRVAKGAPPTGQEPKRDKSTPPTKKEDKSKGSPQPKKDLLDDPNVLTVSQAEADGGEYRTIREALRDVKAGQTIRVLDDKVYTTGLLLNSKDRHQNIHLESVSSATLESASDRPIIELFDVRDVTISGFRLNVTKTTSIPKRRPFGILAGGDCSGLRIEDVETESGRSLEYVAIQLEHGKRPKDCRPMLIENCVFRDAYYAITYYGLNMPAYNPPIPIPPLIVRNNLIDNTRYDGVKLMGDLKDVHVVGNRFSRATIGVQLMNVSKSSKNVLIANNSFHECGESVRLWDGSIKGERVHVRNNLILTPRLPDFVFLKSDKPTAVPQPGDGKALHKAWTLSHNWREVKPPTGSDQRSLGWIPPTEQDVRKDQIEKVNLNPKDRETFLQPTKDSPLGTAGANQVEPSLPAYVGALPPPGVEPWDWGRTWLAPPGTTKLLTVSQDEKDGGKYRTITAALKEAKAGDTVRVLDASTYREQITLNDSINHRGITLEAVKNATILQQVGSTTAMLITGVENVRITGFTFKQGPGTWPTSLGNALISISSHSPGTILENLQLLPREFIHSIFLRHLAIKPTERPVVIRNCEIKGTSKTDGIIIIGGAREDSTGTQRIIVRENRITRVTRGIHVQQALRDVHIVGNVLWQCSQEGIGVEDFGSGNRRILIANNTIVGCDYGFRNWDNAPHDSFEPGQVALFNNLIVESGKADAITLLATRNRATGVGDDKALIKNWKFANNWRTVAGVGVNRPLPLAPDDKQIETVSFTSRSWSDPDFLRPKKGSELMHAGRGTVDPTLPKYVGALAPKEGKPWDWNRSWRRRAQSDSSSKHK